MLPTIFFWDHTALMGGFAGVRLLPLQAPHRPHDPLPEGFALRVALVDGLVRPLGGGKLSPIAVHLD